MQNLLHDGLLRESNIEGAAKWRETSINRLPQALSQFLGQDHLVGVLYGIVNFIVCVPSLVSYTHIVFSQKEFGPSMPYLVKLYFLSSAVMQAAMTIRSSITFSIGQVQDVGLIFLAGMVRNLVAWGSDEHLSIEEVLATCLWQCAYSTVVVGICLICIGRLQLSQYVQMLPLPVIGGYLGYIGYFCLAAGLSIGSGKEINGPDTMGKLADSTLMPKLGMLAAMTVVMLVVHFHVKHFLGMPVILLALPVVFFASTAALGISVEECRTAGWLPPLEPGQPAAGLDAFAFFDPSAVQWRLLPRQFVNVCGLAIIVTFGSSLDIAAIQAEMAGQKIDYNRELITIGIGNLASGLTGGATGSYIFSQTIFSAKRGVNSRLNGLIVCLGELLLFFLPVDILRVLPNSYIGGIMILFGVDIMRDWLISSRLLMANTEYLLVWISFGFTMWLTSIETFGVIEGMAISTIAASVVFVVQYSRVRDSWQAVTGRSSVVRPPRERRVLNGLYKSIFAVSLNSFAFFGASLHMTQGIEAEAERRGARFVCIDFGRLAGMDSTATDHVRLLVLSLERMGMKVVLSSLRAPACQRLLEAHGVIGADTGREVFSTLDQALQCCEERLLSNEQTPSRKQMPQELPLEQLLLEYVDGFVSDRRVAAATADAARKITSHFKRVDLHPEETLFRQEDPADAIFIIASGSVRVSAHREWAANVFSGLLPSPTQTPISVLARETSCDASHEVRTCPSFCRDSSGVRTSADNSSVETDPVEHIGVGGILGDNAYYARRRCGCDAIAEETGCVVHYITRSTLEGLELSDPGLVVFLQKVLLRDLSQLYVQFLAPMNAVGGLS